MPSVPILVCDLLLFAVSITELGLVSSMVGFLHKQKVNVKTYEINWPSNSIDIKALPAHLLVDQGHTTNGAAGYGFVLSVFGLFVAWRQYKGRETRSKSLMTFTFLLFLSTLFTLSALIFTFVVTNQTSGQTIKEENAQSNQQYPSDKWTPENWYKALLDVPLDDDMKSSFQGPIHRMEAWRWMLIPLFLVNLLILGVVSWTARSQGKNGRVEYKSVQKKNPADHDRMEA